MPAGVMNAPRLAPPTALPRSLKNASSTTGLSLGLNQNDGWQLEASQMADRELLKIKGKDEEYESRSGSENLEGGSCEEQDAEAEPPRKKRYHRHTPRQIHEMEMFFKECPHPDEKQRQMLSHELALSPRQVKFWFQNRRTQLKAQQERSDNSVLRMENDNLRAENVVMHEALKKVSCPNCGGPATVGDMTCDEQQLRVENARLKDELDRVSAIAAKYLGRTIPSCSAYPSQIPSSLLDFPTFTNPITSLTPHTFGQDRSLTDFAPRTGTFSDAEKPLVLELAVAAMEEMLHMCQPEETSWLPSIDGAKEILDYEEYMRKYFGALGERPFGLKTEATRETGLVMMNGVNLVEIIMDSAKWMEAFPSIISRASTIDILSSGVAGDRSGALQLMYSELQVLSPLVPTREFYFLRFCKQHVGGTWAVVDVSIDVLQNNPSPQAHCRRRPSGYLIQDMPNGYAKVTVLDHVEYDDRSVNHMYSALVSSGRAFGAQRWLATLQCQCERLASLLATNISPRVLGVIPTVNGRRSMLKLAQRMTNKFCAGVSASTVHTWTTLSGTGENDVRVMSRKSENNPGEPYGIVLSAAASLWLPVAPQRVFEFLRDERLRNEWDILSNGGIVQEMAHIAKGHDPGNSVSLLKVNALNSSTCNMLILQESSIDVSGSLVVYAPVDIPAMNIVMQGGDPGCVSLLPSGFAILPDGPERPPTLQSESEVDIPRAGGSLLTVAFQILVSNTPSAKLSLESVTTVNNLITCTVQKIKATLKCEHV